nr:exodeoxyribonuclease VII small subunit [Microcoleus asticus]
MPLEEVFEQFAVAVECLQECERFLARGKEQMDLWICRSSFWPRNQIFNRR